MNLLLKLVYCMTAIAKRRLIIVNEYHRMAEVGILSTDERVELIAGQVIQKMPKGPVIVRSASE